MFTKNFADSTIFDYLVFRDTLTGEGDDDDEEEVQKYTLAFSAINSEPR